MWLEVIEAWIVGTTLIHLLLGRDLRLEGHHREKQKVYQILFPLDQNCPRKRRNALINARPCLPTVPMSNVFTMIYLRYHFPIITRAHFIFKEVVSWSERLDPSLFPLLISRTYAIVEFLSMVYALVVHLGKHTVNRCTNTNIAKPFKLWNL